MFILWERKFLDTLKISSFIKIKTTLNSEYGSNDAILHPFYLFMKAESNTRKIGQSSWK